MKYISLRVLAIAALALAFAMPAKAQLSDNGYANVDWQFNAPLKNHFADKASGWGMNFEGGYFVTPNLGLGLFMNYSSNHEYFPRATFPVGEGTVNTDQQHTIFQLPFGAAARYHLISVSSWVPIMRKYVLTTICSKPAIILGDSTYHRKSVLTYTLGLTVRVCISPFTTAMLPTRPMC